MKYELVQLCELLESINKMRNLKMYSMHLDMVKTWQKCPEQLCVMFSWPTFPLILPFLSSSLNATIRSNLVLYFESFYLQKGQKIKNSTVHIL